MKRVLFYIMQIKEVFKAITLTRGLGLPLISLLISVTTSCKKFVEISAPNDQIVAVTVFADDATATAAINGLYSNIMDFNNSILNGGITLCVGLSADEIYNRNSNPEDDAFRSNSVRPESENVLNWLWAPAYSRIYHANAIIDGCANSTRLSSTVKQQVTGEAKFIRALLHFYLANLFGDVPLVTTTDYKINQSTARTKKEEVYAQIISDLVDAKNLLPDTYIAADRTHPNKWTAVALLARAYLYNREWNKAEETASEIIDAGSYTLVNDLATVFTSNSQEIIFQLAPSPAFYSTAEGLAFVPGAALMSRPAYLLTPDQLSSFETSDKRKQYWTNVKNVNGIDYFYSYKYKIRSSTIPADEYNIVLRLGEQYLIRAEARAQQDKVLEAAADINIIRSRAGLLPTIVATKEELLTAILQERRTELFAEWGHRWFDLVRTGNADAALQALKSPNWQLTDTLFPLPISQLKLNTALKQNPGY
ncbi:RagB/SusD family nutrient uptake outer membrane protein [Terrimonas alba]|uniref:RagB/SusD family nutrient uptake outer membrane protein n=1 Tax=Terrimonas alba TaxID=3349636 RepID=UPI0035F29740